VATGQEWCMEPSLRSLVRNGDPDAFGVLFDDFALGA
jgi:hypothetical protein